MQHKLAVIGNESSILVYKALGVESHAVSTADEAKQTLVDLANQVHEDEESTPVYAIVFVEESYFKTIPEDIQQRLSKRSLPAVIPVPSLSPDSDDKKSYAIARLSKIVERAVGSDILG